MAAKVRAMAAITCAPDGPYLVSEAKLARGDGTALPGATRIALCRCGGSANKPFCDGTHARNGFTDRNEAAAARDGREVYTGKRIAIFDNRSICAHAGACTDGLSSVFRMDAEPWIDPGGAAIEDIIATIRKCPSGALSYALDGVAPAPDRREPSVTVTKDGPYAVRGAVALVATRFGEGASTEHYTLCRCGASKNKPFCDGSHWHVGFKDP